MYKQLPDGVETQEQRLIRERKENRGKSLAETNPYITQESLITTINTSNDIEDIKEKLVEEIVKKEIKKKRGRPLLRRKS